MTCEHGFEPGQCQAPQGCPNPPQAEPAEPTTLDRLRGALLDRYTLDNIPAPVEIVEDILYADSIAWLIGPPGHGKSFVALDIAGCVATNQPWHDHQASIGGRSVLYLVAEGTSGLRGRVRAWEASNDTTMLGVHFLPLPVQVTHNVNWDALCDLVRELNAGLVVVDTQARCTTGLEENSARDMGAFVDAVERLRRASRACVLVVHHQGRNGDHMRGSTALEGAAATIVRVSKDDDLITIACAKQKDSAAFDDLTLRLVPYDESAILSLTDGGRRRADGPSPAAQKTARAWHEHHGDSWVSVSKLVDVIAPKSTVYRHVQELVAAGVVQIDKAGRFTQYRLVEEGLQ